MSHRPPPAPPLTADYDAIEQAILQTERGQWFLSQYLERNRAGESKRLLDTIGRLQHAVEQTRFDCGIDRLGLTVVEIRDLIARERRTLARMTPDDGPVSAGPFGRYVFADLTEAAEQATNAVLEAAETIQGAVEILRQKGAEQRLCAGIEQQLGTIFRACTTHDHSARQTAAMAGLLSQVEAEILSMIDVWQLDEDEGDARDALVYSLSREEDQPEPRPIPKALVEELSLALLNETHKAALFS